MYIKEYIRQFFVEIDNMIGVILEQINNLVFINIDVGTTCILIPQRFDNASRTRMTTCKYRLNNLCFLPAIVSNV